MNRKGVTTADTVTVSSNRRTVPQESRHEVFSARLQLGNQGCVERNRDLRDILYEQPNDPAETKRQAARVTRQLRMLRAHGVIQKVPKTHRYVLTDDARTVLTALLSFFGVTSTVLSRCGGLVGSHQRPLVCADGVGQNDGVPAFRAAEGTRRPRTNRRRSCS